jgi:hypothetical protein
MTQPVSDGDDLDLDAPLTVDDYIGIVSDGIEEAAHNLEHLDVELLCRAIREKISAVLLESRRW